MYMTRRIAQALLSMIVLLSLTLAPQGYVRAVAVTRYVSATGGADTGDCSDSAAPCLTIQYAINQAAADDTVEVAVGTYTSTALTEVVLIDRNLTLSGGWDAGFVSQVGLSTIDGGKARRGLIILEGVTTSVGHFIIQNGFEGWQGGGIYNRGSLALANSRVIQNVGRDGGGIYSSGMLTINDSIISNNTGGNANMEGGGGGGGIQAYGVTTINKTTISGNKIVGGFDGGAIYGGGTLILNNSTVSGSRGATAIYFHGANLTLNNSTVSGNVAPSQAGGLMILGGSLALNNSTVTANTTPNGTGGILNEYGYWGVVTLRNSIVAGNTGTAWSKRDCHGTINSAGYNLLGTNSGCTFTASTGDLVGTATAPIDPRLLPLGSYGGPTRTHALVGNSPAFGAGNPGTPGGGGGACLSVDQRGVTRPQGARCDMGAYEAQFPLIKSINRASPDPTSAATVKFSITFTDTVTGLNTAAPFSDFKVITAGITGAAVSAVSGSGSTYTVSVKTGSGNGSVKLNLVDDGSIQDGEGNQLGGPGPVNGNFPSKQAYTIVKIPSPLSPSGTIWDRTPTYAWSKIPAATKYQYQLAKGTTTIYTKPLLSSACGTACSGTPLTVLDPTNYKWRARALAGGIWQTWSTYLPFRLVSPKAGFWRAAYDMFYVAPDRSHVDDFASGIYVYGCGSYMITNTALVAIDNGKFFFNSGGYYATGVFDATYTNASSAQGTVGFKSFYLSNCGYITGGPFSWSAVWKNSNQPADTAGMSIGPIVVAPAPEGEPAMRIPAP